MNLKKAVKPIPDGYHSITPLLIIKNADAAIHFYKKTLRAEEIMRFNKPDGKIAHAEIKIGDSRIMLADEDQDTSVYGPEYFGGTPCSLNLYVEDVDVLVQQAEANGAKIERKPENMFYGDRIATFLDPFGHRWHVATHIEDVSIEELHERVKDAIKGDKYPLDSEV